jgi:hypothetical protein
VPQAQDGDQIEEDEIAQFKPADEVWRLGGLCHIGRWKMEAGRWEANALEIPPSREATARQADRVKASLTRRSENDEARMKNSCS